MAARRFSPVARKIVPIRGKERLAFARGARAGALEEQRANRVAEVIFARTRKAPKMSLVEGLPKSMAGLERQLASLRELAPLAAKKEGFQRHGPDFINLYGMVMKSIGYKPGAALTTAFLNRQYFPTPQIKEAMAALKKKIRDDPSLSEDTRKNAADTLKTLSDRRQVRQFIRPLLRDGEIISQRMQADIPFSAAQAENYIAALEAERSPLFSRPSSIWSCTRSDRKIEGILKNRFGANWLWQRQQSSQ